MSASDSGRELVEPPRASQLRTTPSTIPDSPASTQHSMTASGMHGAPVSQPYAYRAPGRDQGTAHEIQRGVESRSWSRRRRRIRRRFATVGVNAVGSSSAASAAACCCAAFFSLDTSGTRADRVRRLSELDEHGGTAAISVVLAKQRRWPRHLATSFALLTAINCAKLRSAGARRGVSAVRFSQRKKTAEMIFLFSPAKLLYVTQPITQV